jgi:hypothetical protein
MCSYICVYTRPGHWPSGWLVYCEGGLATEALEMPVDPEWREAAILFYSTVLITITHVGVGHGVGLSLAMQEDCCEPPGVRGLAKAGPCVRLL